MWPILLVDIFGHINNVNCAIQRPSVTIIGAAEKLNAFLLKLCLWKCRLEVGNNANFPMLEDLILKNETQKESDIFISMRKEFCSRFYTLQASFKGYFNLDGFGGEAWIRNPFLIDLNSIDEEDPNKDDLIDWKQANIYTLNLMPPLWKSFVAFNNITTNLWQSKQLAL